MLLCFVTDQKWMEQMDCLFHMFFEKGQQQKTCEWIEIKIKYLDIYKYTYYVCIYNMYLNIHDIYCITYNIQYIK